LALQEGRARSSDHADLPDWYRFQRLFVCIPNSEKTDEADWYAMFFTDIAEMVPLSEAFMTQAHLEAEQAGLDALDALHIAAAKLGGAEEFVTTERLTTALFRVVGLKMTTIRPTRL
jgi:predicted nucleic acid-binding protein